MAWTEFLIALALFLISHAAPVQPPIRRRITQLFGPRGFNLAYAGLSLAALAWLIGAAGRAPYAPLWPWTPWETWIPNLVMPPVCLLTGLAVGAPNPLSFGGAHSERFDPARPGIAGLVRHPILWALALWALAHLAPNGDLAHVVLFGLFAAFALLGMGMIDRRRRLGLGEAEWRRLSAQSPLWPSISGMRRLSRETSDSRFRIRLAGGAALYFGLILLHPIVIGASPLPVR